MTPEFYDSAIARIHRLILALSLLGILIAALKFGIRAGAGFAAGAGFSMFSFRTFRGVAASMGGPANRRGATYAMLFILRYGLIGAGIYVTVKYLEVSVMALLAGLFVTVAAVLAEVLYELSFSK